MPTIPPKRPARPVGSARPGNIRDALTEAQAISGGSSARTSLLPTGAGTARKTILLVDPDDGLRGRLKKALDPFYEVIEAKDGIEAMERAVALPALAMIVSDVAMPRFDGFALARFIRQHPIMKRVSIVFLSERDTPQDVTQALALGARQYMKKTTPFAQIVEKIRKIAS